MGKEIIHESSNFKKNHTLGNIPSYRLLPCTKKTIGRNSFTELLKSLLTLWVLEETREMWTLFSELKALVVDSEKF